MKTGIVERPPNMISNRQFEGILCTRQQVFVFGGHNGTSILNTAEKYGLARKPWVNLPDLMPKGLHVVSVCEHSSGLYLSGYDGSGTSFVHFNLENETFQLLRSDPYRGYSLISCLGDELYHIYRGIMETANLSRAPTEFNWAVKGTFPAVCAHYWLYCPMKFRGEELITVLHQAGGGPVGLICINPVKNNVTKVATFAN